MDNFHQKTNIESIVLHVVGNKAEEEDIKLSKAPLQTSETIQDLLLHYFLAPFQKQEYYHFTHDNNLDFNEVYHYANDIFENPDNMYDASVKLAKRLYEKSDHPKIKPGEFYTVYFNNCLAEDKIVDAIGLFKSESKETFLTVYPKGQNFEIDHEDGININKLDKGCMIYNLEKENGYLLEVIDNLNKNTDAHYWFDEFLGVENRKDEYFQTSQAIQMCKNFVAQKLPEEFEADKADQAALLNKSAQYFKEKDNFDFEEFSKEVIEQPEVIASFSSFKEEYSEEIGDSLPESFEISGPAVKKQSKIFKNVIKLDKNFHIYIHGDKSRVQQGYDEESGMYYYQLFYENEH